MTNKHQMIFSALGHQKLRDMNSPSFEPLESWLTGDWSKADYGQYPENKMVAFDKEIMSCFECGSLLGGSYRIGPFGKKYCLECNKLLVKCSSCGKLEYDPVQHPSDEYMCADCIVAQTPKEVKDYEEATIEELIEWYFPGVETEGALEDKLRGVDYFQKSFGVDGILNKYEFVAFVSRAHNHVTGSTMASVKGMNKMADIDKVLGHIVRYHNNQGMRLYQALKLEKEYLKDGWCSYYESFKVSNKVTVGFDRTKKDYKAASMSEIPFG